jgi:hypothetical protein
MDSFSRATSSALVLAAELVHLYGNNQVLAYILLCIGIILAVVRFFMGPVNKTWLTVFFLIAAALIAYPYLF